MAEKIAWEGHEFSIHAPTVNWSKTCGGVYIFAMLTQEGWVPLYVGQCDCFCDRLTTHERWDEAAQLGATHVHARAVGQAASRDSLEELLIRTYQPPLNNQLR